MVDWDLREIDLGGSTYVVESVIRPLDVAPTHHNVAGLMRARGVAEALVLVRDCERYLVPVEADGGIDPARLVKV